MLGQDYREQGLNLRKMISLERNDLTGTVNRGLYIPLAPEAAIDRFNAT